MRPRHARLAGVLTVLALCTLVLGCGGTAARPSPATGAPVEVVRIASYDFRENQILAEVYAEAARRAGLPVEVDHGIGTREGIASTSPNSRP